MSGNIFRDAVKDYIVLRRNGKFLEIKCKYKELLKNALSEKLAIIVEFKKEILRTKVLRMTEKVKVGAIHELPLHIINSNLICHSAAGKEFPTFIEFPTRRIECKY
jgi:hypothetical protein